MIPWRILSFSTVLAFIAAPVGAQDHGSPSLRLSTVGVGTADYAKSHDFYTKVLGFPEAFSFQPRAGITFSYLQVSQDTFLELQQMPAGGSSAGSGELTHIHMQTDDVAAIVARLRKAGVQACSESVKTGCITDARTAQPTQETNALIVDPSGIRIEPTQFTAGSLTRKAVDSWDSRTAPAKAEGMRLLVVGIGVKNYAESENFYGKAIGFQVAFKFTSPDGQRTTTYYQTSRDTFLEMQPVAADASPGITHVHILTKDLNATVERLRKAGLQSVPRTSTSPNSVTEMGLTQPSNVKSANVFDPNGVRLELNELLPDSLTTKAMQAWK